MRLSSYECFGLGAATAVLALGVTACGQGSGEGPGQLHETSGQMCTNTLYTYLDSGEQAQLAAGTAPPDVAELDAMIEDNGISPALALVVANETDFIRAVESGGVFIEDLAMMHRAAQSIIMGREVPEGESLAAGTSSEVPPGSVQLVVIYDGPCAAPEGARTQPL